VVLAICALSALLPPACDSEPLAATVAAVDAAAARDLVRSGGHRYLDVRLLVFFPALFWIILSVISLCLHIFATP
jgi:hypothetical protein